ncbi:TECT1 protein, partial [Amia calva]|nr:TECT1 protein [Amia calva]
GIYQSANRFGGLTVLKSSGIQDCLNSSGERSPVLFGVNVVSGCTLRVDSSDNCTVLSEVILGVLRGQSFPQYVASFGNSQPQEVLDWVPIKTVSSVLSAPSCSVPLSVHLEVRWTLYGSLVNPQAQIVNVTERISANSSNLQALAEPSGLLGLSSTVTFIAVSAPAQPEYKAPPTIDASLPFDFFFPFV